MAQQVTETLREYFRERLYVTAGTEHDEGCPAEAMKHQPKGRVFLSIGDCEYNFQVESVSAFPQTPEPAAATVTVDGKEFRQLLDRAMPAISTEESRYTLGGALLKANSSGIKMVATDGHRLSLAQTLAGDGEIQALICLPALEWLHKQVNGSVEIGSAGDYQSFRSGNKTLLARKLAGQFPAWEQIIGGAERNPITASIPSCTTLAKTLARVSKVADERSGAVKWELNGMLELSASTFDRGSAYAILPCTVTGWKEEDTKRKMSIGLNSEYILDFLKVAGDTSITATFRDSQSAALFELPGWQYVVMPMRI